MASKDSQTTDTPSDLMELPSSVVAQAEAAASNELDNDALTASDSFSQAPRAQSNRTRADVPPPKYVQAIQLMER